MRASFDSMLPVSKLLITFIIPLGSIIIGQALCLLTSKDLDRFPTSLRGTITNGVESEIYGNPLKWASLHELRHKICGQHTSSLSEALNQHNVRMPAASESENVAKNYFHIWNL
ncbi:hypothetical protein PGT21_033687 [Puccinia graminis f. sp. tritici]|uniref:Uncharacterized protein n=1 Tax=Puccinia graminis f. sp. tritici TaxID=56615 RepID=A0A5B0MY08_PUCGR|nr:hypothetical protein PGT21_033687 [Puccinia graminis f. sp. tritici]KAA1081841.1 hypothetical protein PGTUg99_016278 [Puccinia graminis f. sp. tritici]